MANRIQLRRGGSQEWRNANPVLAQGEIGIDLDSGRIKIGDGSTAWNSLSYERPVESVANTANSLVQRDSDGNFQAGIITGTLIGNASTATRLSNIRQIQLTQDVVASAVFDGSVNVNLAAQLSTIPSLPHYDGTSTSTGTYTKVVVDAKGRITNASSPTTIQAYGLDTSVEGTGAQPFDNDLRALSQITQTGIAVRSGDGNWTIRQILGTAQQITIANGTGTGANPQLDLAVTSVVPGTYNVESLTSVIALGPNSEPFGTETVNTVKFQVDNRGRLQSSTIVPIATATEGSKYDAYQAGTTYPRYAIIETDNKVYQSIRSIASGGGAPTHTTSDDTGGWRYLAAAAIEQKGLASFAQEDFDVDSNGHVTIAALGVDNTQLQNNRVSFADGNTKEDFELDQELTSTTAYRGFNYLNYVKVNDTSGSLLFSANNVDNDGAGGLDINVDTNISGARIILDRPGTSPLQTIERTAGSFKLHHNVDSAVDRTFDIISNNAGIGGATINITADNDVVLSSTTAENYVKVEDIWFRSNAITSNNSIIIIDPVTEGDNTGTVQIKGNLQVDGITTTVNSTTVTIDDPIITLGGDTAPAVDDNKDRGVEFRYYDSQARLGFFGWDDSYATLATTTGGYRFLYDATNSSEVFSGTDAGIIAGNLRLSSDVESTTTSTGTLAVTGGVGITKRLNVGGNVIFSAELSVTDNVTLNKNVTIVGSNSSATEFFKIQNASAVDKFTVDSSSGNTTILGTLGVTNATTLSSTLEVTSNTDLNANLNVASIVRFESVDEPTIAQDDNVNSPTYGAWLISSNDYGSFRFDGGGYVAKDVLFDSAIYVNGSVIIKDSGASGATSTFSTISARYRAKAGTFADNSSGFNASHAQDNNATLRVYSGAAVRRNLHVGGEASGDGLFVGKFNSGATAKFSVLGQTGNTSISGTLGVTNATTLSSTLSVTDNVTLNKNVTIVGSNSSATEFFKIQNASAVDKFTVDSSSGNTTILGTLTASLDSSFNQALGVGGVASFTNNADQTISGAFSNSLAALRVTGGVSIAKNLAVGTNLRVYGTSEFTGVQTLTGKTTHAAQVTITNTSDISAYNTTANTVSLTTQGGFRAEKNAFIGGNFTVYTGAGTANFTVSTDGAATVRQNLTVGGNLIVNGTTTTVNSTTTTLDDPILTLGGDTAPSTDDNKDRGVEFKYFDGSSKVGFFGYDDSLQEFAFLTTATNTSEVFAGTDGTIRAGRVRITGSGTGLDVDANANIDGTLTVVGQIISTVASGAALVIPNTTKINNLNADLLDGLDTSSTDTTGNSVVTRTSGNFSANKITVNSGIGASAGIQGNALTADSLKTARVITVSGVVDGSVSFNGSAAVNITTVFNDADMTALSAQTGTGLLIRTNNATPAYAHRTIVANPTTGSGVTVTNGDGIAGNPTLNILSTTTASANNLVMRDAVGGFAAAAVAVTSLTSTGLISANGGIAVDTNKFTVQDATGNTAIGGTLGVTGATTLSSTLGVTGDTTLSSTLGVTGATTLSSTLGVTGATTLSAILNANGGIAVDTSAFTVADTTGNTAIGGTLGVTGATTLSSTLGVTGATTLTSTLGVTGATTLSSTLGVTGATTLSSTLGVTGATTLTGAVTASNTLGVTGATTLSSTLGVTGATTLSSTLGVTGATTLSDILNANGGIAVDTNKFTVQDATGNTAIGGTLTVDGIATLNNSVSLVGSSTNLTVGGDATISGNLIVNGVTTTVNSTTITVDDKNIELGSVASPSDTTADGGGLTLRGLTNKTFNWVESTNAWTSSEHIDIVSTKTLKHGGSIILTDTKQLTNILDITASGNITVGASKFTVLGASGNTNIVGTLGVTGTSTFTGMITANGGITAALVGNADTATKFAATKTFSVTGDATAPAIDFDGSDNVALALTLGTSGVVAGTYTKTTVNAKGLVTAGAAATTTDISEGSNLYYTNARVRNKLDAAYDQLNAMLGTIMSAADLGLILSGTATPGVVVAVGTVASGGGGGGYTSSTSVATTTSSGTASGLTVNTTANSAGAITSFTIDNGGSGYLENTTITIPNPNAGRVRTFSVGGLIEGTGYSVGTGLSTSGTGSGCLVNIDAVSPGGSGASFTVVVDSNGSATVTLASGGSSYFDNEVITLSKTSTYGGPTNITVAVNGVSGSGQILAIDTITNNGNTSERIAGTYTIQPPITVGEGRITAISLPTSSGAGGAGYGVGDVLTIIQLGHTGTAASVPVGTITTNATFEITEVTRMQPGATVTGQTSGTTATLDYAETIGVSPNIQHGIVLTNVNGFFEIGEIVSANNVTNLTLTSYYTP